MWWQPVKKGENEPLSISLLVVMKNHFHSTAMGQCDNNGYHHQASECKDGGGGMIKKTATVTEEEDEEWRPGVGATFQTSKEQGG
jgi:hypothetical protein